MKILSRGFRVSTILTGKCQRCGCVIECEQKESHIMITPGQQNIKRYVKCPNCANEFLWVFDL